LKVDIWNRKIRQTLPGSEYKGPFGNNKEGTIFDKQEHQTGITEPRTGFCRNSVAGRPDLKKCHESTVYEISKSGKPAQGI
jgi:hypothetical protein